MVGLKGALHRCNRYVLLLSTWNTAERRQQRGTHDEIVYVMHSDSG
jgi:hypothetical protein